MQLQDAARNVALVKAIRKLGKQYREAIINVHIWTNLRYCEKSLKNFHFMQFLRLAILVSPISQPRLTLTLTKCFEPRAVLTYYRIDISKLCHNNTPYQFFVPPYRAQDIPNPTNHNPNDANIPKYYYIGSVWDIY
ncbi:uncharacterized protein PgNI_12166 [Pyricularia grisea]|uniref:Uncharacterized protein n=1 Tax=Pyricularia grisea TaxID=148305 RepID=A0A6P8AQV3_PYRGI|nr:uncharacterized protein PgNI_12166 [Pyricularia grisea]TLD04421.1 hypothetical protein PgNI_12166 [Pyricularia grisea]